MELKRKRRRKQESNERYNENISFINYMFDEIKSNASSLDKRFSISLNSLSDNQVLEKRSEKRIIEREFNEVLNRVREGNTFAI